MAAARREFIRIRHIARRALGRHFRTHENTHFIWAELKTVGERWPRLCLARTVPCARAVTLTFAFALLAAACGGDSSSSPALPLLLPPPAVDGSFAPAGLTPTMNQARECATATLLPTCKVLIAGGYYPGAGENERTY